MFTALEAFGGVLFASFAGALLFGAISRMSCVAKVVWSEPMVVKYGAGVEGANVAAENDVAWSHVSQPLPCPVLEFRVANLYHNRIGGEIVDARIGIWASTRAEQAEEAILQATGFSFNLKRRGKKKRWGNRRHQKLGHTVMHSDQGPKEQSVPIPTIVERDPMTIEEAKEDGRSEILKQLAQCSLSQTHLSVTEDPSNQLVPSMIFSKLNVETDKHPLFQRVWLIRHRLDASSPLLDKKAHEMIEANNGNWPASLNSHAAVRRHLHFQELMVSLYGTDNVTARSVIANKVYPYAAVRIGYRFAETLVGCPVTGHLHVNLDAMHDVVEQKGGGGEALPRSIHEP